jgi:NAD(P)-dependent dehydrogenase (short-subunit alcohol dehydrogenase family)
MTRRTSVITGASSGIGLEAAVGIAQTGAQIFLIVRDRGRGENAAAEIRRRAGNADVELLIADLASQKDIRRVAKEFLDRGEPLHLLVNNAGVFQLRHEKTVDGIETTFAVNHLAYFLLTELLLPRLRENAPARIVNVASDAHHWGTIDFDDLGGEKSFRSMKIYGRSKLANVLFTRELAERLEGTGVTVNCMHPGAVGTNLGKQNGAFARVVTTIIRPFMRTPAKGADTIVWLATAPELEGVTGKYFFDRREKRGSRESQDPNVRKRLWTVSEQLIERSSV